MHNEKTSERGAHPAQITPDEVERIACAVGGSWLLLQGLRRTSLPGALMAVLGFAMTRRALRGSSSATARARRRREEHDAVQIASEDSFPASDPPSWTATHAR